MPSLAGPILSTERDKVRHLLRRFALGASEAEVDFYGKDGLKGAIDKLLDQSRSDNFPFAPKDFVPNNNVNLRVAQIWWMGRFILTENPLLEKMTLFWHDHFATSAQKVDKPGSMIQHINVLRENALGRFEDLLIAVSKDPAMIFWLDNQLNKKGKPNENFAREIMELFTVGIGHYTEQDVQEAARAFTGWGFGINRVRQMEALPGRAVQFVFDPRQHDEGVKSILGNKGPFSGDDVCGILCGNPQTARHLVLKMWEWFAYAKPEDALIDRLAKRFRENGLKIAGLVRDIMESEEFYSDKAARKIYKNPIDFVVPAVRALGIANSMRAVLHDTSADENRRRGVLAPAALSVTTTKTMGMELMFPPDVAGWEHGQAWISSATMIERIKMADKLFSGALGRLSGAVIAQQVIPAKATSEGIVDALISIFDAEVPAAKRTALIEAAEDVCKGRVTLQNAPRTAQMVCRLMFGMPEFQFA